MILSAESSTEAMSAILDSALSAVNSSKWVVAISAITFNLGARYMGDLFTPGQVRVLRSPLMRRAVLFCAVFTATRDVIIALIIASMVFLVLDVFTNERHPWCVIPRPMSLTVKQNLHIAPPAPTLQTPLHHAHAQEAFAATDASTTATASSSTTATASSSMTATASSSTTATASSSTTSSPRALWRKKAAPLTA